MKTLAEMAIGFSMMPATFGVIVGYVWISIHFKFNMLHCMAGAGLGMATAIIAFVIAVVVLR